MASQEVKAVYDAETEKAEIGNVDGNKKATQKVYRYMSADEFIKMSSGIDMVPYHTDFREFATNSKGFCFLGEKTESYEVEYSVSSDEFIEHIEKTFDSNKKKISEFRSFVKNYRTLDMSRLISFANNLFPNEEFSNYVKSIECKRIVAEYTPAECRSFLIGIVSEDVLVEFEVSDNIDMREGDGFYADGFGEIQRITEFSCKGYNIQTLVPIRWAIAREINMFGDNVKWESYDSHKFKDVEEFYEYCESLIMDLDDEKDKRGEIVAERFAQMMKVKQSRTDYRDNETIAYGSHKEFKDEREIITIQESHEDEHRKKLKDLVERAKQMMIKLRKAKELQKDYEKYNAIERNETLTK